MVVFIQGKCNLVSAAVLIDRWGYSGKMALDLKGHIHWANIFLAKTKGDAKHG
jgi:hypothetical protein